VNALGGLFNWTAFRNPAYAVYCVAGIFCFLGLYTGRLRSVPTILYVMRWLTWLTDLNNSDDLPVCMRHSSGCDE